MSTQEQVLEEVSFETKESKNNEIVLYNDEVNTFDHVINCLIRYCEHTLEQAEQCAWITHYKGKCQVLTGDLDDLKVKAELMGDVGLTVEVQ